MSAFVERHVGPRPTDIDVMLRAIDAATIDEVIDRATPAVIRLQSELNLPAPMSEPEVIDRLRQLASHNTLALNFIGQGYYGCHVPSVVQRNILENPAWYTSYTPYQPEISQGRLEALLNFQTMITDLTGLDIAGASLLDEPTAVAEAMTLMLRQHRGERTRLLVDVDIHPQSLSVLKTRALPLGIEIVVRSVEADDDFSDFYGVVLSLPGSSGVVRDLSDIISKSHASGTLVTVAIDLLSSLLIKSAGEMGADIAVGSAQRFGVPMGFGGPHAGFMAVKNGLERSMPGRLVGASVDVHGNPAYRLALQTREQHIRREKATSNICTAQALLAICSAMYVSYHGYDGLKSIAINAHQLAAIIHASVTQHGWQPMSGNFFDTVTFDVNGDAQALADALAARGINVRVYSDTHISVSVDETTTFDHVMILLDALDVAVVIPESHPIVEPVRSDRPLQHPVFSRYHSETEMMRYLRKLSDKDLALDRTMIPLGSCTMKLNAATEMAAITWPEFAHVHPFVPREQAAGWLELIEELESFLVEVTGYDAVSLQPNAGSQGEFAGLLAVKAYHDSRGEGHRDICLIPSSAHGTNAASAVMAGMKVIVVACDDRGNVDVDDLKAKIETYGAQLAAIMITYPSTHGVFEDAVSDICAMVHEAGGQVYVDGANLNALVGVAKPGKFGADVSHLNLHKTFCIPHGGGGPGVGPVGVRSHLAPFLPASPLKIDPVVGAVSGSEFGSAGILPIPYAYIMMMGGEGLTHATKVAILSANYIARKLANHFPILYTNEHGYVAHECIIDLRDITKETGVSVDDVAKRLIDYGFHAPTMSFPVAGTLMIEPTESESLAEVDRFINAMLNIAAEIEAIRRGEMSLESSPLRMAPHTAHSLMSLDEPSENKILRAYPHGVSVETKYWPPVGRIDGAYGDRNLTCTCLPIEDLAQG